MLAEHAHGGLEFAVDEGGGGVRRGRAEHGGGADDVELPRLRDGGEVAEAGAGGVRHRHRHGRLCKCEAQTSQMRKNATFARYLPEYRIVIAQVSFKATSPFDHHAPNFRREPPGKAFICGIKRHQTLRESLSTQMHCLFSV